MKKSSEWSIDKTEVRDETREGAVLGTVAYMSPEHVQGKVVDHRSDIFSFGSILYEASTRRRPFEADSDVDVMHNSQYVATGGGGYGNLQQVATLSGAPRKLAFDVDSRVSFSPDGKRMTFLRGEPQVGFNSLWVANADGTGEKRLARWQRLVPPRGPSWSPDGKTIAFSQSLMEGGRGRSDSIERGAGDG